MDGEFVKNYTHDLMLEYMEYLNNISNTKIEVHLMVKDIKNYIDSYSIFRPSIIYFHIEAVKKEEIIEIIDYIKNKNIRVGITIKPDTKVEDIYEYLPYVHSVLIMTVEPGEGGQEILVNCVEKVKVLKDYINKENLEIDIAVDGGVNNKTAKRLIEKGANILISGSYITNSKDYKKAIESLKEN